MDDSKQLKPLIWIGSTRQTIQSFPLEVRKAIGFALYQAQEGGKYINAKPLKGFSGAGVLEVVEDYDGDAYRAVYTIKFAEVVYALHAFQKKSKRGIKTPKQEVDLIKQWLKKAEQDYEECQKSDRRK